MLKLGNCPVLQPTEVNCKLKDLNQTVMFILGPLYPLASFATVKLFHDYNCSLNFMY